MVKITDIIVGDWFQYMDEYIRIENIYGTKVNCVVKDNLIIKGYSIADLKPIDITPDFLENNNFDFKESWDEWWHMSADGFGSDFQLSFVNEHLTMKDNGNAEIKYINHLQHAFRICGMDDIADSIKVK